MKEFKIMFRTGREGWARACSPNGSPLGTFDSEEGANYFLAIMRKEWKRQRPTQAEALEWKIMCREVFGWVDITESANTFTGIWYSVKDVLPEPNLLVLVTCSNSKGVLSITTAFLDEKGEWHRSRSTSKVIAWMFLPDTYKETVNGVDKTKG